MGLEAIHFFFRSEEQIEYKVVSNKEITSVEGRKYVYKGDVLVGDSLVKRKGSFVVKQFRDGEWINEYTR